MISKYIKQTGIAFIILVCAVLCMKLLASPPAWWEATGISDTNAEVNDYAPVNQGQLKWLATKAYEQISTRYPGSENNAIQTLVNSFSDQNNYAPVNIGQLKYIALPFYDRLIQLGLASDYPWATLPQISNDYALANVGQAKYLFSFPFDEAPPDTDIDGDGIPDWWELLHFGSVTNAIVDADPDSDNLTNLYEYQWGTDPANPDTDDDGLLDGTEVLGGAGLDPLLRDTDSDGILDGDEDSDGDGYSNSVEQDYGTDINNSNTIIQGIRPLGDGSAQWYVPYSP